MPIPVSINKDIKNPFIIPGLKKLNVDPQLNPNYTFENYIEEIVITIAPQAMQLQQN